ncbi:uncharacterized protein LOC134527610 [Bacillus rossius redtenbacheri]|uniref:uncharacterized protein LOC134527610 n=1 Tax=Bacillus rossius redtenbacheri TaxID=93214 RepID=UPI002FDC7E6F
MADSNEESETGEVFISVTEALKLINQPFDGTKNKLKEFCDNVDTAFDLVNPERHRVLLKFVKSKIVGDAKAKILVRENTDTWEEVKEILEENYAVRRTLDFYACRLFNARQGSHEPVVNWGSRVDTMVTELKEAALKVCTRPQENGAMALIQHLARACFVQGLSVERIQTVIRSKGAQIETLGLAVESALEEESNLLSLKERIRPPMLKVGDTVTRRPSCSNCGKGGHTLEKCFLRKPDKNKGWKKYVHVGELFCKNCNTTGHTDANCRRKQRDDRKTFQPYKEERNRGNSTCFECGKPGHYARNCFNKYGKYNNTNFAKGNDYPNQYRYDQRNHKELGYINKGGREDRPSYTESRLWKHGENAGN